MSANRRGFLVGSGLLAFASLSSSQTRSTEPTRVSIAAPGPGNLLFLPITLANKIKADLAEGIELDIRYVGGGPQAFQEMLNKNTDFSAGGLAALGLQKASGKPVVCIAPLTQVPAYTLLARKQLQGKVKSVKDLRGKVVGVKGHVPGGRSTSQLFSEYIFNQSGVAADQLNFVSVGQSYDSQRAALLSGAVDALMGDEPFASRLVKERSAFVLADFHDPVVTRKLMGGLFLNGHIATRDDVIAKRPEVVEKVVKTMKRTLTWIHNHSAVQFADALQLETPEERSAMIESLTTRKNIYSPDGVFSMDQVATVNRFLHAADKHESVQDLQLQNMVNSRWAGSAL